MKWELAVERKDIDVNIQDEKFIMRTKDSVIEFGMNPHIAYSMLMQMKAIMQPPWIQDEEMVELAGDKTLLIGFSLNSNDHWVMDLRLGDSVFYASMSLNDLKKFSQVLGEYFEKERRRSSS